MLWGLYQPHGGEKQLRLLCKDISAVTPPSTATSQHEKICSGQKNPLLLVGKGKNLYISAKDERAVSICDGIH